MLFVIHGDNDPQKTANLWYGTVLDDLRVFLFSILSITCASIPLRRIPSIYQQQVPFDKHRIIRKKDRLTGFLIFLKHAATLHIVKRRVR